MKLISFSITLMLLLAATNAYSTVVIDGKLDESVWKTAQQYNNFKVIEPRTGDDAPLKTQAFFLPQKEGLYIGFINVQKPENRRRSYSDRDRSSQAESNTFVIDFAGKGEQAFSFSVSLGRGYIDGIYTLDSELNTDWDGPWDFAVSEDENAWYSEFFIPWKIATLAETPASKRKFNVWFSRFNTDSGEKYATPYTWDDRSNFLRELASQSVDNIYQSTGLDFAPYVTANHNNIMQQTEYKVGADLFWKFTNNQQLIVTVNPDFGAVESDDVVINYSSVEELLSDKRAFFTENQSLFDLQNGDNLRMLYSRRIGAGTDGLESEQADINFAAKYLLTHDNTDFGLLLAQEKDSTSSIEDSFSGKDFYSMRWKHSFDSGYFGQIVNWVERDTLDRTALTSAVDYGYWQNNSQLTGMFIYSKIKQEKDSSASKAGFVNAEHYLRDNWSISTEFWYLPDTLELDDFGYLERNNLKSFNLATEFEQVITNNAFIREITYTVDATFAENFQNHRLADEWELALELSLQDNAFLYAEFEFQNNGLNDQLTWGDSSVMMPNSSSIYLEYGSPQYGDFQYQMEFQRYQSGFSSWGTWAGLSIKYAITDNFILDAAYYQDKDDEWFIGSDDHQFDSFKAISKQYELKAIYLFLQRHQLSLNTQWSGLQAGAEQSYSLNKHQAINSTTKANSFDESVLSLQIKYRFRFAEMSDFYLVYTRNGQFFNEHQRHTSFSRQISQPFRHPDDEQLIAKIRWYW